MKILRYFIYLLPLILFIGVKTCRELKESELGSRTNPIKIYFTPSVDAQSITSNARDLVDFLEKETGYHFVTAVPASFIAVVEAFGSAKADIASINTFSYLMANEKYGANALLRIVRDNNQTTYRGQFVARVDSGIDSLKDIEGRSIAYVDASSTSGYILPSALLAKMGIKPSETVFGMKHDNVITMVYQGQVDVGATYWAPQDPKTGKILDARMRVQTQFPDVAKKVKIIGLTDPIPNDPIVFRKGLDPEMREKIINAILKFLETPKGAKAMYEIYDIVGLVRTTDKDYDVLRNMLKELNISVSGLVKK